MACLFAQQWQFLTELIPADGAGLVTAAILTVLNLLLLPAAARPRLRMPLVLLLGHVICLGLGLLFEKGTQTHSGLGLAGLFLLLASDGISAFLLITQSPLGRFLGSPPKIFLDIIQGL